VSISVKKVPKAALPFTTGLTCDTSWVHMTTHDGGESTAWHSFSFSVTGRAGKPEAAIRIARSNQTNTRGAIPTKLRNLDKSPRSEVSFIPNNCTA
jgi:hypothetical protein